MSRRIAYPFLVLPDDAVRSSGWLVGDPGEPLQPAGNVLEHWDYARDLEIANTLSLDWPAMAGALQLPEDELRIRISLVVGTGVGRLPRRQSRLQELVVDRTVGTVPVSGRVAGRGLSGRLHMSLLVALESPENVGTALSPRSRGSRLWQNHHDVLIEDGGDSRFPIEAASFSGIFGGSSYEHALWYLHWRQGALQGDFSAAVRLYVNSDRSEWLARVTGGDGLSLQMMMADVMSQLVESALRAPENPEVLTDCETGSLGHQILQWLETAFPGQEIASVRTLMERDPGAFRAALLAAAEVASAES
ncbi:MAG: hypothetical protein OZ919_07625 [Xanthomonadaceae bacterium]|nr:hypothetical protein [Xanthomonadaceae bacterium]